MYHHVALPLQVFDWRGVSAEQQHAKVEAYLQEDRRRGFTLTEAPLMRLTLIRLAASEYLCLWTYHHSLLDGRSRAVALQDLFAVYAAFCAGQEWPLPPPRPYQDYIAWLQQQDWRSAKQFWRQGLQGFTSPTPLVFGSPHRQRPEDHSGNAEQTIQLSAGVRAALQALATTHQLTLNTFVQAAWALLLSRYSGEEDVIFDVTRACRRSISADPDELVGLFINTLPFRSRVSPGLELIPWLKELRDAQQAIRPYEHTPLMKIQAWSDVPAGTSLFDSILVFEHAPVFTGLRGQGGNGDTRAFELREHTSYPLTLAAFGEPELLLKIEYDRGRFDAPTITRMLTHLQTVLESMAAHPDQRVADVLLLSTSERQQLLERWNQTAAAYPRNTCIHHLFEAQVERTPQAMAFQCGAAQLSYKELDERANQLAHHLRARGVGPHVLVGICVERSLEMAVGLLGILKAGGAYVPLDPNYPQERLGFMLNDAQVPVLLTQQHLIGALPEHHAAVVCLDADWKAMAQAPRENPQGGATAENFVYVIYTSGSTGRPKGVLIPHRGLVNHSVAIAQSYGLGSDDRVLQFASPSFDIAVKRSSPPGSLGELSSPTRSSHPPP